MGSKPNKWRKNISSSPSSFQRERGVKPPAKGILIVTEGKVTERVYFEAVREHLKLQTVELLIVGMGIGDPRRLAEAALEEQKKRCRAAKKGLVGYAQVAKFDEIWIVFDTDTPLEQGKLHDGLQFAASKGIQCAHSTPCFEYWLLLHFERAMAPMPKGADVEDLLEKVLKVSYKKEEAVAEKLIPPLVVHLERAEENAEWVKKQHASGGTGFPCNPSTEVGKLIAALRKNER